MPTAPASVADGDVDANGTLHGNLYIQGTGDPKLVPEELIDLVDQIRKNGITGIDGALVLDKRYFDPSTRDLPAFDADESAPYCERYDAAYPRTKAVAEQLVVAPFADACVRVGADIESVPAGCYRTGEFPSIVESKSEIARRVAFAAMRQRFGQVSAPVPLRTLRRVWRKACVSVEEK